MAVTAPPLTPDCRVPYNGRADNNRADLLSQASGIFRMQALVFKITVVFILLSVLQDFQVRHFWSEVEVVYMVVCTIYTYGLLCSMYLIGLCMHAV